MTIPHLIRKVKKVVILKCLACNWTNFSFVLRKLLEVRCDVLLEINDGFFFDRHLSRAQVNRVSAGKEVKVNRVTYSFWRDVCSI